MPRFTIHHARLLPIRAAILAATLFPGAARAHEASAPHLIHEFEAWVALAVALLSLAAAAVLIGRALRR